MNTPMEKFEIALDSALENRERPVEDVKADILLAIDQLLVDSAVEMAEISVNGVAALLLQVYKTGVYPAKSPNAIIDELTVVLADAGRKKQDADNQATHDSY